MKTYFSVLCVVTAISAASSGDETVASACNNFSQNLYQTIALTGFKNCIYSPLSIHQALSTTMLGARGDTAAELSQVLGLDQISFSADQPQASYREVVEQLRYVPSVKILTANAIFLNPSTRIEPDFIQNATNYYHSKVSNFDLSFPGGPEEKVNLFVEKKTGGLIKNILMPGTIHESTVMTLINTLYFNGTWQKQFSRTQTVQANFHTPQGTIQVETMFDTRSIKLKRNFYGADVGQLDFRGKRFSLVIILPQEVNGLFDQESTLIIPGVIENMLEGLSLVHVKLSLPKVKTKSTYDLNSPLKALGIVRAFDPHQADFQGISTDGDIFISNVVHKAVIDITETGTTAAAATAIIMSRNVMREPPTEAFYVNRPFLYFIYDSKLELILFQGKFTG